MNGNRQYPYNVEEISNEEPTTAERLSVEQLERLVQLIDGSDVAEIEVKRPEMGMRLVLRKAKGTEQVSGELLEIAPVSAEGSKVAPVDTKHTITAPLVGIFHSWAKPKGKAIIQVGDVIKEGQLVGTIQSLNVLNEVESPTAGRVVEILVQDGQGVEYGQPLVIVDSAEGA
ncbi:MAG TPA: biotin/lipoyl-containing protein [Dictyobacter sp.]|jgi:biotin carboxyl carrier protein|nr:biotin/lipoyl-containing protein [Dictyobacter sp.]